MGSAVRAIFYRLAYEQLASSVASDGFSGEGPEELRTQ